MSDLKTTQMELPLPVASGEGPDSLAPPLALAQAATPTRVPTGRGKGEGHSPFVGHLPADRQASDGPTGVHLKASTLHSVVQLSTWPTGVDAWQAALAYAIAAPLPQKTGDTQATSQGLAMRIGPEELMLVSDDAAQPPSHETVAALRQHVNANLGSVLDLSHARCRIRIEGERCEDTLSKLFALDFREIAFPAGKVKLSSHHHVPCALYRTGTAAFDAYVFTTYAREMLETFADAALEYGLAMDR